MGLPVTMRRALPRKPDMPDARERQFCELFLYGVGTGPHILVYSYQGKLWCKVRQAAPNRLSGHSLFLPNRHHLMANTDIPPPLNTFRTSTSRTIHGYF